MKVSADPFFNMDRDTMLSPALISLWEHFNMGVVIVDGDGFCNYMNPLQKRIDGFEHIPVIGEKISDLYLANESKIIPSMQCLLSGEPILKKVYWYKTKKNELINSVNDFFPLYRDGRIDGIISFTVTLSGNQMFDPKVPDSEKAGKSRRNRRGVPAGLYTFDNLIGEDRRFREAIAHARAAVRSQSAVMIWGESGSGKELFAQSIHSSSDRSGKPFIPVNCAAIPETLLEGMLFGTSKGAFTDAADKPGLFEEASGGTLLLDELNSMPLGLQAKLLRVIQEKRIRRVGSLNEIPVDVKIISTLNEHPLKAIEQERLRRDLYYRLAVVGISIPPLRQRKEDIPLLARSFLARPEYLRDGEAVTLSGEVFSLFSSHDWPGNIRELLHVIEGSLALLGDGKIIGRDNLPTHFREACEGMGGGLDEERPQMLRDTLAADDEFFDFHDIDKGNRLPLKACLKEYEERCIRKVLRLTGGNVAKASRILEMSPSSLHYRIKTLGI